MPRDAPTPALPQRGREERGVCSCSLAPLGRGQDRRGYPARPLWGGAGVGARVAHGYLKRGMSINDQLLAMSHSYQHSGPIHVSVRIISAREATKRERQQYENEPR